MRQTANIPLRDIQNVNEALLVLKHFIDLSSRLLPFLDELHRIDQPTTRELYDRQRIIAVYENYHFDTETSEILIGSNILELIKDSFYSITRPTSDRAKDLAQKKLVKFILEHKRLRDKWNYVSSN